MVTLTTRGFVGVAGRLLAGVVLAGLLAMPTGCGDRESPQPAPLPAPSPAPDVEAANRDPQAAPPDPAAHHPDPAAHHPDPAAHHPDPADPVAGDPPPADEPPPGERFTPEDFEPADPGQPPHAGQPVHPGAGNGRNVVVWINVDGVRHDYVDRANPPFLSRIMTEGAYSRQLRPIFPSVTFPTHISMATGVTVDGHGITGNSFYDRERDRRYNFAPFSFLPRAEQIWNTAARQGLRAAVVDWPMSHRQQEIDNPAAYYGQRYDGSLTDEQRIENLLEIYREDDDEEPLVLLLGYASQVDTTGHRVGPDDDEVLEALRETDTILAAFVQELVQIFDERMDEQDELWLFVTTDHGMSKVHTLVNVQRILGDLFDPSMLVINSGPISNIFLHEFPEEDRQERIGQILERLNEHEFITAWRKGEVPERYGYDDPHRVGDVIVSLAPGYTFTGIRTADLFPADERGPLGMHGYPADEDPDMYGFMAVWRYRVPLGGVDLGEVDQLQLHPTVAALLGIEPAEGARAEPIRALLEAPAPVAREQDFNK